VPFLNLVVVTILFYKHVYYINIAFFTSVGLCDVDKKGVQYMLLCQVILGNLEAVEPGFFLKGD
jgi:hypothetical protein